MNNLEITNLENITGDVVDSEFTKQVSKGIRINTFFFYCLCLDPIANNVQKFIHILHNRNYELGKFYI